MKVELIGGQMPVKSHSDDAGYDIHASEDIILPVGTSRKVPCGFKMQLPKEHEAQIRSRSGLADKHQVVVLNSPGTVDTGYRGEINVILANFGPLDFEVKKGDRIAQMVIAKYESPELVEGKVLDNTDRGEKGFGSTGN